MYISSNIAERIKFLSKNRGIIVKKMLIDLGLGENTMSNLKTSMPKADNLAKIADYLDCSVDYLLGRDEYVQTDLSSEEKELLAAYRSNPDMQQAVNRLLGIAPAEQESKKEPAV